MSQLALPLKLQDHAVFDSFLPAENGNVVAFLKNAAAGDGGPGGWLRGQPATGKTHLLQALCAAAGSDALFVPLVVLADAGPELIDGLANRHYVCLDDVDRVAGDPAWEAALFGLANAMADSGGFLLCSAAGAPLDCGFELPDLASRFARLPVFQLQPMAEADCLRALKLRARHRGLELPDDAARFLMHRSRRDMSSLYELLDRLDTESLKAQRRLTVPFIRKVIRFGRG